MEFIFIDTETTGNEIGKDRLCQVCYRTEKDIRVEYFKPPVPVSVKSMSITHITNKMLEDKESFIGSQMEQELQKLLLNGVMVAHNAIFDCAMLQAEGITIPRYICTLKLARFLDKECVIPEYNLQFLRYYLDLEVEGEAHDAEGDVNVLHALFSRLFQKIKESIFDEQLAINKMIEISSTPSLFKKFNFGKYKGQNISEVARSDRGYLEWLLKQKLTSEEDEDDWVYTLRENLK
ncbi:MAG TPA: exonuclease domain-containing protein [Candidatus Paceibacterota bacterium]